MAGVSIDIKDGLEPLLERIPIAVRAKSMQQAMTFAVKPTIKRAKELVPQPGYEGDDPEFKPLRDTIMAKTRDYGSIQFIAVGPGYPAGAHGHLVEFGHKIVTTKGVDTGARVRGKEFLAPAVDQTKEQVMRRMEDKLRRLIKKHTAK